MGISTEQWRISIGSFTPSSHRSEPERLQQNPSTRDYKYIMRPVAHILLALLVALSLMSALTGINILSKGFNPTLSIPFQSTKTLYKQSILIDMDIQSEPGPDQVKVSQLSPTARNLYNKLRRIDSRIIRSRNRLLIFRNHLKSGTPPKGYSPKINPSIGSNHRIFKDKWQSNIDNYGKMQLNLTIN